MCFLTLYIIIMCIITIIIFHLSQHGCILFGLVRVYILIDESRGKMGTPPPVQNHDITILAIEENSVCYDIGMLYMYRSISQISSQDGSTVLLLLV